MARPAKFTHDDILDGAAAALVEYGPGATVAQISTVVGAPVGSIYHRFATREHLLGELWLRSIRHFHVGLLNTAEIVDPRASLLAQAVHQPRFCRDHPAEALVMSLYSQRRLLDSGPVDLRADIARVNDEIWKLGREKTRALYGRVNAHTEEIVAMAIRQTPYGMIRNYVRGAQPIPEWLDDAVLASAASILDLAAPMTPAHPRAVVFDAESEDDRPNAC